MNQNVNHIIKSCLEGDRKSQKLFFEKYNRLLFGVSLRYMNSRSDAEEVLQESWIQIFRSLDKYVDQGHIEAWLKKLVIRTAWKAIRKKSSHIDLDQIRHPISIPLDDQMMDKMTCEQILNFLEDVPQGSRQVFKMFVLEGFSHAEIGEELNITASTSRAHLTKARKILLEKYNSLNRSSYDRIQAI